MLVKINSIKNYLTATFSVSLSSFSITEPKYQCLRAGTIGQIKARILDP